ncbi:MAG TPA: acyltransferase [Mycobacterium sp.]|nr:acyltransferase [Mycobacterium sp.]
MVFSTSVIRKLAPSEDFFAETHTFTSVTLDLEGPLDVSAMSTAFDILLEVYPVYSGHIEQAADGRFHIVAADDLMHPGIWYADDDEFSAAYELDQTEALINLLVKTDGAHSELTLYVHHSLSDGTHIAGLALELFTRYTALVTTGDAGPVTPAPAPEPIETLLEARGIRKGQRSGLDRFIPAMFAHELPPRRATSTVTDYDHPVPVPTARARLSKEETTALTRFGRKNRLFVNNLVSAAILLAEWRIRETPHVPIPYVYNVNLRPLLEPPVSATGCTLALGVATYLAQITADTDIVELARDIAATLQTDLADGVVQQSLLHFNLQYEGNVPGLADVVLSTNIGNIASAMPMPPDLRIVDLKSQFHRASSAVIDVYGFGVVAGELILEHHVDAPDPQRALDMVLDLLRAASLEHQH